MNAGTGQQKSPWSAGFMLSTPALAGLLVFVAVPFLLALILSFTNLRMGSPLPLDWVGWEQYRRIFSDPAFAQAITNNLIFALVVVPVQTTAALSLALLLNRNFRGLTLFRTLFFLPVVFPLSLVAVIWMLIFAPGPNGMLNALLKSLSFGFWEHKDFLHDPLWALPAIMLTSVWQGVGFQMVILLAGLQSVPRELYESAAMDGAGKWAQFRYITLPQLRNILIFVVLVTSMLAFRLFDQVQIMTKGGPQLATTTMMYEAVQSAFTRQQVARGAAMTVVLFVIVLWITWVQRRIIRERREIR